MPVKYRLALPLALLVVLMAAPSAHAVDPTIVPPPDATVSVMLTGLPGLVVVVSTDTNGYLTSVDLLSSESGEAAPDYLATKVDIRRVRFENSETGTRVEVRAKENMLETKVQTGTLAELVGTHTWSGPVLGDLTNVTFTVKDESGTPTLSGIVVDLGKPEISGPETKLDDHETEVEVKIWFSNELGQRADLKIDLKTEDEKMRVPSTELPSLPTSWTGVLCDVVPTPASVTWVNHDDGSMTDIVVTPGTAEVDQHGHGFRVRFGRHAELKVSLNLRGDDTFDMKVDPKIKCNDGADPDVNTPVDEKPHKDKKQDHDD